MQKAKSRLLIFYRINKQISSTKIPEEKDLKGNKIYRLKRDL